MPVAAMSCGFKSHLPHYFLRKSLDFQGFFCVVKAFAFEKLEADSRNSAKKIPSATYELPYEGAKEMLVVENVDDKDFLTALCFDFCSRPIKKMYKIGILC